VDVPPDLVRAAQSGDRGAIEDLVAGSYRQAYALALRLTGNPDDASEATQDAYIRVVRSLKRLEEPGAFTTWLFRIVSNVCMTQMRRRSRRETPMELETHQEPDPVDVEEVVVGGVVREELEELVSRLPDVYRTVVVLRDVYGMSGEETAEVLGISTGAVKVRLHRARRRLRDDLLSRHPDWAEGGGPRRESA